MPTTRSPREAAFSASSSPVTSHSVEGRVLDPPVDSSSLSPERPVGQDRSEQVAIEGRDPLEADSRRRAIGIMFGIDPKNLYEAPNNDLPAGRFHQNRE